MTYLNNSWICVSLFLLKVKIYLNKLIFALTKESLAGQNYIAFVRNVKKLERRYVALLKIYLSYKIIRLCIIVLFTNRLCAPEASIFILCLMQ
jgi:hypothetical protein